MAFTLGKKKSVDPVGLDLDGDFAAAVQTTHGRVSRAASVDLPEGVMREGEVIEPAALGAVLKGFFRAQDLPKRVRIGVANQQIVVRQIELPKIEDPKERDAAVRFQAAEAVAMPLEEAVLDHQVVGEAISAEGTSRMLVVVVAARRKMIQGLVDAISAAGLKAEGVDLNAFALVRLLARNGEDDEEARAYLHLGGITNLAVAIGRTCLFTRPLAVTASAGADVDATAAALAEEIRPSVDFYLVQPNARPISELVISGPGATTEGLAEALSVQVGVPVQSASPLGSLDGPIFAPGDDPHRHTVAAGLALGAAG
ncbi:MAG TPA: pilus assembly protein PilM [Thermoleophilaceae bacterium]|nr:pilus assembly protein PilM [Thermoleophilaceae bacterium]